MPSPDSNGTSGDPARVEQLFHAAGELPDSEQTAFLTRECGEDRQTEQAVRALLAARYAVNATWESTALELEARHTALSARRATPGEFFGPYRILRRIAAGGMSWVYEAWRDDAEFEKQVAIKFVQQGTGDLAIVEQFRRERQILAQLEHPYIARLLDGGTTGDDVPYLVMEFVDGMPIDRFAHEHHLSRSSRLRLFLQVCEAVEYAHRNLVVHRDLKPANILVTPDGTPKLLDFGIAKLLSQRSADTALLAMTPEYASPEQMLGRSISTVSDVYSLGVLLFALLAGRLPYRDCSSRPAELVKAICEEDPVWEPAGLIAGDLRSILTKALRKEPEHRYSSVAQLAGDVWRYLDNRPVIARPASWGYYAARFITRNRALTAIAACLVLAVLTGLAGVAWQAHRAGQQRTIAQHRFDEARRLINTVIHEIQPKLAGINGTVLLRQSLVEQTLVYLEALGKDARDSPALMQELIEAYIQLATVSGDASTANTGDYQRASATLGKAAVLANALLRIDPSSAASLKTVVHYFRQASRNADYSGRLEQARAYARQAMAAAERLVAATPGDNSSQEELATATAAVADTLRDSKLEIPLYQRSLAIWQEALRNHPSDDIRQRVALMYRNLSTDWSDTGDQQRALDYAAKARVLDEELLAKNAASPAARMALAFDIGAIGWAYYSLGDYAHAAENMSRNVALRESVVASNSGDWRAEDRLAYALRDLAQAERQLGNRAEERRYLLRTLDIYGRHYRSGPLVPQSLRRYALCLYDLGQIELAARRKSAVCGWFGQATALLDQYEAREGHVAADASETAPVRSAAAACHLE